MRLAQGGRQGQCALIWLSLNLLGSYILVWEYLKKTKNKKNHITKAWNGTEPEKKITNRSTLGSTEGTEIPPELGSPKDGQRKSTRWRQGESKGQPTPSPLQFYGKIEVVLETPSERNTHRKLVLEPTSSSSVSLEQTFLHYIHLGYCRHKRDRLAAGGGGGDKEINK